MEIEEHIALQTTENLRAGFSREPAEGSPPFGWRAGFGPDQIDLAQPYDGFSIFVPIWLEALASQKGYVNPTFSNSSEALIGTRKTVNFTSTATLTTAAYSGRYTKPAGG